MPPGWYASLGPGLSLLNHGWGLGAAVDAAGNATGVFTYGLIGLKGFFLSPARRRRLRARALLLHDGVHGHHRDHPDRRDGRALGVEELLPLRAVGRAAVLPLRELGLGRRLPGAGRASTGASATARSTSPARAWCTGWAASSGSQARIVIGPRIGKYVRRQAAGDARPQRADGRARHVHPRVRLVRLQSGLDPGRHRPAHQLRGREHDARQHHRRDRRDARRSGPRA